MTTMMTGMLAMMGPQPGTEGAGGGLGMLMPMMIIFGIFYFMLIRPQQRKEKERLKMIEEIKSGDRVIFSGGIMGTVANIKDNVFLVKVADNVKVEVLRGAISKVLDKGEKPGKDDAQPAAS